MQGTSGRSTSGRPGGRGTALLASVAGVLAALQVTVGPLRLDYGWDETVYVSQVARHVPAAYFSAPRARGVVALVAPVAFLTTDPVAVRLFLILVSAIGLLLAFRLWLPRLGIGRTVLAAALFASLWQSHVYGSEVYPNYWIGLLAVATVAFADRIHDGTRAARYGTAICLAAVAAFRPGDAVWLWLALVVGARLHASWRTSHLARAATIGLVAGFLPWVVEAQLRYGGVINRMGKSSATEGGLFPHPGFLYEARALYGPLLCRPCTQAAHPLVLSAWWLVAVTLVIWTLRLNRSGPTYPALALSSAAAAAMATPYMFLVGYSAPRFLLPAYAIGAIPVGHAVGDLLESAWRRRRRAVVVLVAACLVAFAGAQAVATAGISNYEKTRRGNFRAAAEALNRLGVQPPCLVVGRPSPPIGFEAGCGSEGRAPVLTDPDDPWQRALRTRYYDIAVLVEPGHPAPPYVSGWQQEDVPLQGTTMTVFLRIGIRRCNAFC